MGRAQTSELYGLPEAPHGDATQSISPPDPRRLRRFSDVTIKSVASHEEGLERDDVNGD